MKYKIVVFVQRWETNQSEAEYFSTEQLQAFKQTYIHASNGNLTVYSQQNK